MFDGTLPVRPYHPDGFIGTLQADGQQVRVAALVGSGVREGWLPWRASQST